MHVAFLRHDSSDQSTEIMAQLSRQQCAGGLQTHIYSPGGAVKAWLWQTKKSQASDQGKRSSEWDSRSVLLYWSSLVSGFLSKHSLLSTSEIPQSPISRDDSLPLLRSRRGALGAFDNSVITAGAIYPFLIVPPWVKEHNNFSQESDWPSFSLSYKIKSTYRGISCKMMKKNISKEKNDSASLPSWSCNEVC